MSTPETNIEVLVRAEGSLPPLSCAAVDKAVEASLHSDPEDFYDLAEYSPALSGLLLARQTSFGSYGKNFREGGLYAYRALVFEEQFSGAELPRVNRAVAKFAVNVLNALEGEGVSPYSVLRQQEPALMEGAYNLLQRRPPQERLSFRRGLAEVYTTIRPIIVPEHIHTQVGERALKLIIKD